MPMVFQSGVPMQNIQAHGAWASNAVWQYLKHTDRGNIGGTASSGNTV